jgi:hypothetical protein
MLLDQAAALRQCIHQHRDTLPALAPYSDAVQHALGQDDLAALIAIYHAVYPLLEQEIWYGQAFLVNRETESGDEAVNGLNYFYYINHIFSNTPTTMLTGKLVGDPPVSPSVMAANFMDDVIAYMKQLADTDPEQDCRFHRVADAPVHDAAYHDMARLFGFEQQVQACAYHCPLAGQHNNLACLQTFAEKLNAFFLANT